MSAMEITNVTFSEEVLGSEKPVLLDFWAPWCTPCRMVLPILEEIAAEREDIKVCKINIDEQPELANTYGIMSIPTLMVFQNGEMTQRVTGARSKEQLLELL